MNQTSETHEGQGSSDIPTIKMYQDIVDRAHSEVESVRKVYYWLSGIIGVILSVGIGSGTYLTYKSLHDIRSDMKNEVDFMKAKAIQDYSILATDLKASVKNNIQDVEGKVNTRIDTEFNKDNIQGLVKDKAQDRIDKVADNIIGQQINNKIAPKMEIIDNKLKILNSRNELIALADKAIAFGDSKSLYKLINIEEKELVNNTELHAIAAAEETRFKSVYVSGTRIPDNDLECKIADGTVLKNNAISTKVLINELLNSSDFNRRGKAARLLKDRKEKIVANALLQSINNEEERLDVRKETIISFRELTGYKEDFDVFGRTSSINGWWKTNKSRIERDLK